MRYEVENHKFGYQLIGAQEWQIANLNVSQFSNGDLIPEAATPAEWVKAYFDAKPAWCHYPENPEYGSKYGKLYNWFAVHDSRGLAPQGWRLPTDKEWSALINNLGGDKVAGNKMKSASEWGYNDNADNSSGFSALPAGYRSGNGEYGILGKCSYFWAFKADVDTEEWIRGLISTNSGVQRSGVINKGYGFSCRCIRDKQI
jgi:uncharacterized protein (TIGR02145 family)